MCGRVRLENGYSEIKIPLRIPEQHSALNFERRWNGARHSNSLWPRLTIKLHRALEL